MYLYNLIKFLEKIRIPSRELPTLKKVINTTLIFLLGVGLGIFSKWLDNLSIDDSILWQHSFKSRNKSICILFRNVF